MTRWAFALILLPIAAAPLTAGAPSTPKVHTVELNGHVFTLPVGFDIELVAGRPLVERPIEADFDEQGRLYVTDSSGSNENVQLQLQKKPHRVLRLEDSKGDGRFDRRTVFADHVMFPEGVMWHAGSLYVAAPPSIWKLTDTDGDGVADQRIEWFQGKTLTGCANDLHGPYLGPDGWLYWCKGAFAKQTYERPSPPTPLPGGERGAARGKPFVTRAAHIFRCRPDGSGIEPVMTGGMDNPVEVVFTPGGERIFTTTFFQHPGGGRRDGLVHAVYGGVYGKVHDVISDHPWTGPDVMPVLTHLGPAAPCGLARYESAVFGPEYKDNLFATLFNLHKVTRHVLEPNGATFKVRDEDFLVSSNMDFHPTDVLEDADGSLLVIDTGGWYKLCCPTSQLHKPDVLGAIYRVRRTGARRPEDPRGLKLPWMTMKAEDLAQVLDDPRPAVRRRAIQTLASNGAGAVPVITEVLRTSRSAEARRNAVWAATRIDHAEARQAALAALADPDDTVRQAALHSISVRRDREALPQLLAMLKSRFPHNRRAAAEALGRIGDRSAVPALLEVIGGLEPANPGGRPDRVLEHSLTFALIEIADAEATTTGLRSANPLIHRAAFVALDQMEGGGLKPEPVVSDLSSTDPALKATASWIAGRHPEWGGALAGFLGEQLAAGARTPAEREELVAQLARLARVPAVQQLLADTLRNTAAAPDGCRVALLAMAQSGLKEAPAGWVEAWRATLVRGDLVKETVAAVRAVPVPKRQADGLAAELLKAGQNATLPATVRLTALAAVPGGLAKVEPALLDLLQGQLDREQPVANRTLAADVLARAHLTSEQLLALSNSFKTVGSMELEHLLDAFAQSNDERVGRSLVAALLASPARPSLRAETLKPRLVKFGSAVQQQAQEIYAGLDADAAKQKVRLEELVALLHGGDIRRGQAVFNSSKASCSACHAVGYLGGNIGPDLTRIGQIRTERDLMESIAFPSASFVRGYEPLVITTRNGKQFNGVIRKDAADEIVLATGVDQEVRIARESIEDMQPSTVSVMPAGLDQQLTPHELADLVAFLKACK